jgi:TPP-dependent indolepyruvate ferredoxin oxidoreductase alpha subunit
MNGSQAIAGALRTCADTFYAVPGYPVTTLADLLLAEPCTSEKVALEYALGDSLAGRRAAVIMKNVGLNACADPLINATTQGLLGGVVIIAGDDPGALGSQNTEDSRYFGEIAQVPVLEPGAGTCAAAIEAAFEASERFSRIAIVRVTPALLEHEVTGTSCTRHPDSGRLADPGLTMRGRAQAAEILTEEMFAWSRSSSLNQLRGGTVAAGAAGGDSPVVTVYPPPADAAILEPVNEIGRPFLYEHRHVAPPSPAGIPETFSNRGFYRTFCHDCPFRPLFAILRDKKMQVIADIGCSTLALNPPYRIGRACYALGSSVAVAARSTGVALIGDYALLHSGINGLFDVFEKGLPLLCIVLVNEKMGMTGGQPAIDPVRFLGWAEPVVCDAGDTATLENELVQRKEPHVLVVKGLCPAGCRYETVEC